MSYTPGPWKIHWYNCTIDNKDDLDYALKTGNSESKIGDIIWRMPTMIGPCTVEHSHWGGFLLNVNEADARLIAAAPMLLEALQDCVEALAHLQDRMAVRVNPPTLENARAAIKAATEST